MKPTMDDNFDYKSTSLRNATAEDMRAIVRLMQLAATVGSARVEALEIREGFAARHGTRALDELLEMGVFNLDADEAFTEIFCASNATRDTETGELHFLVDRPQ